MAQIEDPQEGQVWVRDGKQRIVVEVNQESGDISIGWQRPGEEWHTYYAQAKNWLKWAAKAQLVTSQPL